MFYQLYLLRHFPLSKHTAPHNVSKIGLPKRSVMLCVLKMEEVINITDKVRV